MHSSRNHLLKDASGALGDLGTLLPLSLGAIGVAGLAPTPVLLGFAVFYIATGLYYRLPIPVQPMKAVAALLISTQASAESLVPLGALPMCHGAGGLAAHYRFGARTGMAPVLLGVALLALALLPGGLSFLAAIPAAGLGALLMVAAIELAFTGRLRSTKPSCWPVIAVTAMVTVCAAPFLGLLAGLAAEKVRVALMRRRKPA